MKPSHLAIAFCSFTIMVISAAAQISGPSLTSNPVYTKDCAKCHGKTAEGRHFSGPSLQSDKVAAMSADALRNIITNGKGHMPKFAGKLTPDEIDFLVKQIQLLNKKSV